MRREHTTSPCKNVASTCRVFLGRLAVIKYPEIFFPCIKLIESCFDGVTADLSLAGSLVLDNNNKIVKV